MGEHCHSVHLCNVRGRARGKRDATEVCTCPPCPPPVVLESSQIEDGGGVASLSHLRIIGFPSALRPLTRGTLLLLLLCSCTYLLGGGI